MRNHPETSIERKSSSGTFVIKLEAPVVPFGGHAMPYFLIALKII
jgi:hypothetical protein